MMKIMNSSRLFYRGSSMKGTFKPGDKLIIEEIPYARIKRGDVVVFGGTTASETDSIVHRVVGKCPTGLIMRGDNNPQNDIVPIPEKDIRGRVSRLERNGRNFRVLNGKRGTFHAAALFFRLHIIRAAKFLLRRPYSVLKKSGIVAKLWHPEIETIHFETQDGPLVKYLHNGRSVATFWPNQNKWTFKRPYEFLLGPKKCVRKSHFKK